MFDSKTNQVLVGFWFIYIIVHCLKSILIKYTLTSNIPLHIYKCLCCVHQRLHFKILHFIIQTFNKYYTLWVYKIKYFILLPIYAKYIFCKQIIFVIILDFYKIFTDCYPVVVIKRFIIIKSILKIFCDGENSTKVC